MAAAFVPEHTITHLQQIQHERFVKDNDYHIWDVSLSLSGNIAVSGYNNTNGRTFIDIYWKNADSKDNFKLLYSKEFEIYSRYKNRSVSFLGEGATVVTLLGDKLEIFDTKNDSKVLRFRKVNDRTSCLTSSEGQVFIAVAGFKKVFAFHYDLDEWQSINLKAIPDFERPWDLQVFKNTVFLCEWYGRPLSIEVFIGDRVTFSEALAEYTDATRKYIVSYSVTFSEKLGIVAVLWGDSWWGGDRIIFYSLHKDKPLLICDVDAEVLRIRISDKDGRMITGNRKNGEIKIYDLEQLFSFEAMKKTLALIVTDEEVEELRKHFSEEMRKEGNGDEEILEGPLNDKLKEIHEKVSAIIVDDRFKTRDIDDEERTVKRMDYLFTIIEEKGYLDCHNINKLKDAVSALGDDMRVFKLKGPIEGYERLGKEMKGRDETLEVSGNHQATEVETESSNTKEQKEQDPVETLNVDSWFIEKSVTWWKKVHDAEQKLESEKEVNSQPTEKQKE